MSGRRVLGAVAVVTVLAAVVAWWHYYPTSPLIARLGLPGPRADSERHCGRAFRYYHRIRVTTGDITCRPLRSQTGVPQDQEVNLDPLTRRVKHGMRMLAPADSISWAATRDSIHQEMSGNGGQPIRCYPAFEKNPPWIVSVDAWRFRGYTVRFISYHWFEPWKSPTLPTWLLQLDGYSGDPPGCGEAPLPPTPPPF